MAKAFRRFNLKLLLLSVLTKLQNIYTGYGKMVGETVKMSIINFGLNKGI